MEIKKLSLTAKVFEKLYNGNDIPKQYAISGKQIDTRQEVDGCRFLFVENETDKTVYCYFQGGDDEKAVMISKGTLDNALNIYAKARGRDKFVKSANVSSGTSIIDDLVEMQKQPEFMKAFASATKKSITKTNQQVKDDKQLVIQTNKNIGGEMEREMQRMSAQVSSLKGQRHYLVNQRNKLINSVVDLKTRLEQEEVDSAKAVREISKLIAEGVKYLEERDAAMLEKDEAEKDLAYLRKDYERLEAEKEADAKAYEKENKAFAKMYKELWKDFLNMKHSNTRNSQNYRAALEQISVLQNQVSGLERRFEKSTVKVQARVQNLRKQNAVLIDRVSSLKKNVDYAERSAQKVVEKLLAQIVENGNLKKENAKLKAELEEVVSELIRVEQEGSKNYAAEKAALQAKLASVLAENSTLKIERAKKVAAAVTENYAKTYQLHAKDGSSYVYLAVGPHYEVRRRTPGQSNTSDKNLYVISGGDPTNVKDQNGNIIPLTEVLVDPQLRGNLEIHGVKEIVADKKGFAKVKYYDAKKKLFKSAKVVSSNNVVDVKDVDAGKLNTWIQKNYGKNKVRTTNPTLKTQKALKVVSIIAAASLVAGGSGFGVAKAWGGPNEYEQANNYGKQQIEAFVDSLGQNETLFQYAPEYDAQGNAVKYTKTVNGQNQAIEGNKITAIGHANRVFFNDADRKVDIEAYKQENFWGKLKNYETQTVEGAAYQLGAEVVEELIAKNVPTYKIGENGEKSPLYLYLNYAADNSNYSNRDQMINYLAENGYANAEKMVAAYEEGFKSGFENGLSNNVDKVIGSEDVVNPPVEKPVIEYNAQETKAAITAKVATTTLHGADYTADELHVVYSDLDADGTEQVIFVAANKSGATGANLNKYLYKVVLGNGSSEINVENINSVISNATEVTENIKMDYIFKAAKYADSLANYNEELAESSTAYVSNYGLSQSGNTYSVAPTITVYDANTQTIKEESAKYSVSVEAGKNSSVTEMCALAILGDYGYFDAKGIYTTTPLSNTATYSKTYSDNDKVL